MSNKEIEQLELKYLNKFYYFLKYAEDEMMLGFQTKEKIKDDWHDKYGTNISNFAVGAERIIYALFNGKGVGQPNSCPVGSDMFFEVDDAYIHIDLKTVQTRNIGDITRSIFVGRNQNSYKGTMLVNTSDGIIEREYEPALPTFYNKGKETEKICLSYFVTIVYEDVDLNILNINLICMPNGNLESHYKTRVLQAGKNLDKTRFRFTKVPNFELLEGEKSRVKVVYFDNEMEDDLSKKLSFYKEIYLNQGDF
ncbi:PDDEXK family nuclease [Psychroserpens sp. MEBiC05023]